MTSRKSKSFIGSVLQFLFSWGIVILAIAFFTSPQAKQGMTEIWDRFQTENQGEEKRPFLKTENYQD
jgi:hypothetical protein